jgi:tetratricopeptide (TPR) repeat protein
MIDVKGNREARLSWLVGALLVLGTVACYWPVSHFDFINLDDPVYVYSEPVVRRGLTWYGFGWAFRSFSGGNWNPLVWLSHMADCQLYGVRPGGHHVTNLFFHALDVILLFLAWRALTGTLWRSAFVAAIFAWHPMHVESVAWVAERKDVMSAAFWFGSMWAYALFARASGPQRARFYGASLLLFALGLMCKSMLVTLPLVFLLLDYWPLRRQERPVRLLQEKVPFLLLSIAASGLAVWSQSSVGATGNPPPIMFRIENAAVTYAIYLQKFIWPAVMAVFYPLPHDIPAWSAVGTAVLLIGLSIVFLRHSKSHRYAAVGWLWFLGTLVPVIGLVQVGMQSMADRYTYIPYIGLAVLMSWCLGELAARWPQAKAAVIAFAGVALLAYGAMTVRQMSYWRSNEPLYQHAIAVTSGNYMAYNNLGNMLLDEARLPEAKANYEKVVKLMPTAAKPYNNLGNIYAMQNRLTDAMPNFRKAIELDPSLPEAHYNLGNAYYETGKIPEAIAELKIALRLKADYALAQARLIDALMKAGRPEEAIGYARDRIHADPSDAHARFTLGWAYQAAGQPELALASYRESLQMAPDTPQCLNAVAWILATSPVARLRNGPEALTLAEHAAQLSQRKNPAILDTLGAAYANLGRFREAIATTEEGLQLAREAHDAGTEATARQRLLLYRQGKPFRDEK